MKKNNALPHYYDINDVIVSIKCLVYNHEPFLRQCLDGFVMQKTNFRFEAIVHDDASTDNSAAIIMEYAEKYPDIIKPIFETENQYSKHDGSIARIMNAAMSPESKYIAYCEGDDYWIDPLKLQKQVDFLETHKECVICSHDYLVYREDSKKFDDQSFYYKYFKEHSNNDTFTYDLNNYAERWWTQPCTYIYRKGNYLNNIPTTRYKYFRDSIFAYYILKQGKGCLMTFVGSVYRRHAGGIWAGTSFLDRNWKEIYNAWNIYYVERDTRVLDECHRAMCNRLYHLKNEHKYKMLLNDLMWYFRKMPMGFVIKLFGQILKDKYVYIKTKIK